MAASLEAQPRADSSINKMADVYTGSAEETYFKSPMVPDSYKAPYNPDEIWQKTGSYKIYEEMIQDDQVSICLQLKKDLILGSGFEFISEDEGQSDITDFLYDSLTDSCLSEGIQEMMTAYENGFSLTEKIFDTDENGMVIIKHMKTRHPNSWLMHQDDKGNITKYEQNTAVGRINVNPKALIHFVNNRRYQNPYGISDLRACYAAWFAKRQIIRFYAIFLEKAASPLPVARYEKNAPDAAVTKIYNTIKKLQASTAMAIPKDIELTFLESKSSGEAYYKAINIFNMFIGRSLFVPDLLGMTGSETGGGSHALGKEQIDMFFMHIIRRRAHIEKIINDQIVWPMIVSNFGFVENYPKFRFAPLEDIRTVELAKVWVSAVSSAGSVYKPNDEEINYFRSLCKFPEGDVERVEPPAAPVHVMPGQMPGNGTNSDPTLPGKDTNDKNQIKSTDVKNTETPEPTDKKTFGKVFNLPPGDYYKKCDFKKIDAKFKDYDASVLVEAMPIIKKQFADLYDQIQKKNILKNQDVAKIDTLQIKYLKDLKQVLKESFRNIYQDGMNVAQAELLKSRHDTPVPNDEFLAMLEDETFQYIGDYQYTILKKTRAELIKAIKDGDPLSSVIGVLDDEGKNLSEVSLERFARTKHTEAFNKGRLAFFEDSGVVAAYQYSAVLDDTTSDICLGLDGKIFEDGDQPVPPMHFNCRSILIPITKYEDYTASEKAGGMPIDDFIEENKGSGFAKYCKGDYK